jgi:hypothetical protein
MAPPGCVMLDKAASSSRSRRTVVMADPEGTRQLEAILAADVAGYSRLMQADDEATVTTLEAYRAVFREQIQAHRGRVVDMAGDSVLAVLDAATRAVRAAFEIQSVTLKIVAALSPKLAGGEQSSSRRPETTSIEAYDLHLRGKALHWNGGEPEYLSKTRLTWIE